MSKLHVVGEQRTLADLAPSLLRSRLSKTVRADALDAIRRANPGLDLDDLAPGTVIVVPAVEGLRADAAAADPLRQGADDLVDRVRDGVEALTKAAEAAEEARKAEKEAVQALLGSSLVQRLASQSSELATNVDATRSTLKNDDAESRRQLAELHEAAQGWFSDLDGLRALMS
jgi:hypothetical protein